MPTVKECALVQNAVAKALRENNCASVHLRHILQGHNLNFRFRIASELVGALHRHVTKNRKVPDHWQCDWVQALCKACKIWFSINLGSHSVSITFTNMWMEVVETHVKEVSTMLTVVLGWEKWLVWNGLFSKCYLGRRSVQPLLRQWNVKRLLSVIGVMLTLSQPYIMWLGIALDCSKSGVKCWVVMLTHKTGKNCKHVLGGRGVVFRWMTKVTSAF